MFNIYLFETCGLLQIFVEVRTFRLLNLHCLGQVLYPYIKLPTCILVTNECSVKKLKSCFSAFS